MKTDVKLPGEPEGDKDKPKGTKPVRLDFSKKPQAGGSPFTKAKAVSKRIKMLIWGASGVGKTTLVLQFPKLVMCDTESGSDLYGDSFDFDVLKAASADQVMQAVDWLLTHKHEYRTLAIDPITVYWDSLQRKWSSIFLRRNKSSKGFKHEFYDLQPRDWLTVKSEFKELIRKLVSLDMSVVVTARQKVQYGDSGFMKAVGETFDGEKSLPYLFDIIIRMYIDEKGRRMCVCMKDRTNKLPKEPFEADYKTFENLLGKKNLTRKAKPIAFATSEQKARITAHIKALGYTQEQVDKSLAAYEAESLDELSADNAEIILKKLDAAAQAKNQTDNSGGKTNA